MKNPQSRLGSGGSTGLLDMQKDTPSSTAPEIKFRPNSAAAVDFLRRWAPSGPWLLVAILDGDLIAASFNADEPERLSEWRLLSLVRLAVPAPKTWRPP